MSEQTQNEKSIVGVLKEATEGLLSEEVLNDIETVFQESVKERVALHVEKALSEQDEDHAVKLEKLLEAVDSDHTRKLKKLVRAINTDHTHKLKNIINKFNGTLNEEAKGFKQDLVDNISNYLELYVERSIPEASVEQAMRNTSALKLLEQMRGLLAVDDAVANNSIRVAIKEGKETIDALNQKLETLHESNKKIEGQLIKSQSDLLLEQKTKELPETKRKYLFKVLGNKTPGFINENFDYTLKLLEKTEEERLEGFKQQAEQSKQKVDRPTKKQVVVEQTETSEQPVVESNGQSPASAFVSDYMEELKRT